MELKGKVIHFLGDSITEGCGTSGSDKRFSALIADQTGAVCNNYGISGTRIAPQHHKTNESFDRDYLCRVNEMDEQADVVVVFGGTNDFGHGDAPFGTPNDRTPETFCGAAHCLCRALIERYPGKPVVLITPLHRLNEDDPRGDGGKPEPVGTLAQYVAAIRQVAEYYSLPVLDLWATSGLQPKVPIIQEKFVPDGLHPNDAGHQILAQKIIAFLQGM